MPLFLRPIIPKGLLLVLALLASWCSLLFFFFNDTATPEIYTLSLHDALPICIAQREALPLAQKAAVGVGQGALPEPRLAQLLQSAGNLGQPRLDRLLRLGIDEIGRAHV